MSGEPVTGGFQGKVNQEKVVTADLILLSHPSLPGTEREAFTNGDFRGKCKCPFQKGSFSLFFFSPELSLSAVS